MTNAELIAKIKAEIERLKGIGGIVPLDNREQKTGYESALIDIETFLDSLESKKPMQEGLEEEVKRYLREECSDDDEPGIHEIAEHFAEFGYLRAAEKYNEIEYNRQRAEESVPNDLEEAAEKYAYEGMPDEMKSYVKPVGDEVIKNFIAGAKWTRAQMMENAVEGEVRKDGTIGYFEFSNEQKFHSLMEQFQDCDRVRIIIVKEDEK